MTRPRLWIVAHNDGEAAEIIKLLRTHGEEVLVSRQQWGASWVGLEAEIHAAMGRYGPGEIAGVELGGPAPHGAINIDHHRYADEDRSHPLSSLEQVAELLGTTLSRWQWLVALNDRGYIPAMASEGGATPEEIAAVRRADRAAQGVTPLQEQQAARDVREHATYSSGGRRVRVWCPEGSTSAHADTLYGAAEEILLESPAEWNYYGPRHRELFAELTAVGAVSSWSGGGEASGYCGLARPEPTAVRERLEEWWARE